MVDCKYILPCGRCEKRGAPCDATYKSSQCEHDWHMVGSVGGTKARYRVFVCSKCGEQQTERIIFNKKDDMYKVFILDDENT